MRLCQCDQCGSLETSPHATSEDRARYRSRFGRIDPSGSDIGHNYDWLHVYLEANEDGDGGHFCSWPCLAEWAMSKAMAAEVPTVTP